MTVTYNSEDVLADFLTSVSELDPVKTKLFAIDNASKDTTVDVLSTYSESRPAEIIRNSGNRGVAFGNNQGIVAALKEGFDWILLINNDTCFNAEAFHSLVREAERVGASIISPFIEAEEPPHSVWYTDAHLYLWRGAKVKHVGMGRPLSAVPRETKVVSYASTCVLLVHSSVFKNVGLMDPQFFVYGDDVDFAIRARRAGLSLWSTGSAVFFHKASSLTGEYTGPFSTRWITRNWVLACRIHCSRVQQFSALCYMTVWTLARLLVRADPISATTNRVRAFLEGLQLAVFQPPSLESWPHDEGRWAEQWDGV
ncbi:glycosyltransferase family 2 protein [Nocardioides solisilvae]|uniref:glycosyltransferase family 2 protein n=1 Tax=Nocardioides solisilvae TaxID=1542435 RepID=UPI003B846767